MLNKASHVLQRLLAMDPCVSASNASYLHLPSRQPDEAQGQAALGVFLKVLKLLGMPLAADALPQAPAWHSSISVVRRQSC